MHAIVHVHVIPFFRMFISMYLVYIIKHLEINSTVPFGKPWMKLNKSVESAFI